MRVSNIILVALIVASCSPKVLPPVAVSDSVRVVYRDRIVHDTAYIEIPLIKETVTTEDTLSMLDNGYAKSSASIENGRLHHSLETIPQKISMPISVVVHDTAILATSVRTIEKEIEKPLSLWQQSMIWLGRTTLILLIVVLCGFIIKMAIKI